MKRSAIGIAALAVMLVVTWGIVNGAERLTSKAAERVYTLTDLSRDEVRRDLVDNPFDTRIVNLRKSTIFSSVDSLYPTWAPQSWGLGPVPVVGAVGEIVDVPFYWAAMPDSAINMFYRAGVQCDSTLRIVDVVPGPDASPCYGGCLTVNVSGNTAYDAIWLDCGWSSNACGWAPFSGVVAVLKVEILEAGAGNMWIETTAGAASAQPNYYNMNHVFPTRYFWDQNNPGPREDPCTKPWAYATTPEDFNGTGAYDPCVGGIDTMAPMQVHGLFPVAVEGRSWGAVKRLFVGEP